MKGVALGRARKNGTFSVSFPRAGVGGRSSWQFLHFVRNPATSPGSMGSSCPGVGGDAAFWGGCFVPLGWRQEQLGHVGALGPFSHLYPLFWCPHWHHLIHLIPPPEQRNPCPWFPTSLSHLCGFPFRSGLVLFGASPALQHPAPTLLHVQPRGGQKPCTPPKCTQMQLHGGAEGHAT